MQASLISDQSLSGVRFQACKVYNKGNQKLIATHYDNTSADSNLDLRIYNQITRRR